MASRLLHSGASKVRLKILIFGPNPTAATLVPKRRAGRLARKRIEIRDALRNEGHEAVFPEEIYEKAPPAPFDNPVYQECIMMKRCDLIVIIVDSPGSNVELGLITGKPSLACKTHAFIDAKYKTGFAYKSLLLLKAMNGEMHDFDFPDDIDQCHLMTAIVRTSKRLQLIKYLS